MTRQLLATLTTLTIALTAFGQYDIGISENGGLSKIHTDFSSKDQRVTNDLRFSGNAGLFYDYHFNNKSSIETGFLFMQIAGKENHIKDTYDPTGTLVMTSYDEFYRHISYIGLPIQYGLKLKKFTLRIGGQVSSAFANKERNERYTVSIHNYSPPHSVTFDKLNIDNYDFGINGGLLFNLNDNWAIETTYYYGLNNIYKNSNYNWTVRQMAIGLRYTLKDK
ncbi:MAG: PorT family protein [Bacteroidetes bacterium]|nr:PorT family protein [Bacteroidota bacterium]